VRVEPAAFARSSPEFAACNEANCGKVPAMSPDYFVSDVPDRSPAPHPTLNEAADNDPLHNREQQEHKRADPGVVDERATPGCSVYRDGKMPHRYRGDESGKIRDFANFDPKPLATVPFVPAVQATTSDEHDRVDARLEVIATLSTHTFALFEMAD